MMATTAALAALGLISAGAPSRWLLATIAGVVIHPALALAAIPVGWVFSRWWPRTTSSPTSAGVGRRSGRARTVKHAVDDQIRCAHLLIVGLSAGLTVHQALGLCAAHGPDAIRPELEQVLRTAQRSGIDVACAHAPVRLNRLLGAIAGAERTGMPLLHIVVATAEELRRERMAEAAAKARRLPAQLAAPLALGVLPGFVLLVMGPTILAIVERMILRPM